MWDFSLGSTGYAPICVLLFVLMMFGLVLFWCFGVGVGVFDVG